MSAPVHFSDLKVMAQSPKHYRARLSRPKGTTPAMMLGVAVDRLLFGGPELLVWDGERKGNAWDAVIAIAKSETFYVYGGESRAGKAWTSFKAGVPEGARIFLESELEKAKPVGAAARAQGSTEIFTTSDITRATRIVEEIRNDPVARRYVEGAEYQVPLEWELGGRLCATRGVDILFRGMGMLGDLKVSHTAQPSRFSWHAQDMLWHAQLAWYFDACQAVGIRMKLPPFFVAAEAADPYPVVVMPLTGKLLEEGRECCAKWLSMLRVCEDSDHWPGYSQCPVEMESRARVELDTTGVEEVES